MKDGRGLIRGTLNWNPSAVKYLVHYRNFTAVLTAHIHIESRQPKHTEVVKLPALHADGRKRISVPNSRCLPKRCFEALLIHTRRCCCSLASAKFIKIVTDGRRSPRQGTPGYYYYIVDTNGSNPSPELLVFLFSKKIDETKDY